MCGPNPFKLLLPNVTVFHIKILAKFSTQHTQLAEQGENYVDFK